MNPPIQLKILMSDNDYDRKNTVAIDIAHAIVNEGGPANYDVTLQLVSRCIAKLFSPSLGGLNDTVSFPRDDLRQLAEEVKQ